MLSVNNKKGFSIVELLVVMAIMGVLFGLAVSSYTSFRNHRSVDEFAYSIRDLVKTARSKSLSVSSLSDDDNWPVAYEITIINNGAKLKELKGLTVHYEEWDVSKTYPSVDVENLETEVVDLNFICKRIIFESVSGSMFLYDDSGTKVDECTVTFNIDNYSRVLRLNSLDKAFDVQ